MTGRSPNKYYNVFILCCCYVDFWYTVLMERISLLIAELCQLPLCKTLMDTNELCQQEIKIECVTGKPCLSDKRRNKLLCTSGEKKKPTQPTATPQNIKNSNSKEKSPGWRIQLKEHICFKFLFGAKIPHMCFCFKFACVLLSLC